MPAVRNQLTRHFLILLAWCAGSAFWFAPVVPAGSANDVPSATLIPADTVTLPSLVDSNSPVVWDLIGGRPRLFVLTSEAGKTTVDVGTEVADLTPIGEASFEEHPGASVWFEAVVPDVDGTWYGFYHNEWPADVCDEQVRTIPRIGAARSRDFGLTWQDLGTVLESPPGSHNCASPNAYFVGGVGDFSVMLDQASQYLYFFFSQYASREAVQGVSVARLAWADRDAPVGKMSVWVRNQTWLLARRIRADERTRYIYSPGMPIYRVADGWHNDESVDAFWGPAVHWNTYLGQYVMLLNRAQDSMWRQDGIYVAFAPVLDDPGAWSIPERLITGGQWYPQVVGIEEGTGTDRLAGEYARFFMSGRSDYFIQFHRR